MQLMLLSHSCHGLVCAFSSCSEWGDLKKPAHCVRKKTHFPRQLFHQKKLRCIMMVVSIACDINHKQHFFGYNNSMPNIWSSGTIYSRMSLLFPSLFWYKRKCFKSCMSSSCYPSFMVVVGPYNGILKWYNFFEIICVFLRQVQKGIAEWMSSFVLIE